MGKILAIVMILHPQQIRITQLGSFDDTQGCMEFMQKVVYEQQLQGVPACIPAQAIADWLQQTFGRQA
jgi:hypothetical protein